MYQFSKIQKIYTKKYGEEYSPNAGLTRDGKATYPIKSCREKQCLAINMEVNTARLSWNDKSLT
jgi:hypothetical protein